MRILLTGGTGFIGQQLGKEFVRRGHSVVVLTRNPDKAKMRTSFPAAFYEWDGEKEMAPSQSFEDVDAVIHMAGESIAGGRWTDERKKELEDSRIKSAAHLTEGLLKSGQKPKVFIGISAIGYYGYTEADNVTEASEGGSDYVAELCKRWEAAEYELSQSVSSMRYVQLRLGVVLGEGGGFLGELVPLFQKKVGAVLGNGKQWISWIQIDDLVQLIANCIEDESYSGVYNATAPEPIQNKALTHLLAKKLNVGLLPPVPSFVLKLLYGEMSEILLKGAGVRSERLKDTSFRFKYKNFETALEASLPDLPKDCQQVVYEQWLPVKKEELFQFFKAETNLEEITPPWLGFKVKSKSTKEIESGTKIKYKLSLRGLPMEWESEILEWKENEQFVDIQRKGPYSYWHHLHQFEDLGEGTLLRDRVTFKLPLGALGRMVAGPWVSKDVKQIFGFRQKVVYKLYGRDTASRH